MAVMHAMLLRSLSMAILLACICLPKFPLTNSAQLLIGQSDRRCANIRSTPGQEYRAEAALRGMISAGVQTCIMLSGRFFLASPLRITAINSGLQIRSSQSEPASLVATRGTPRGIEVIRASDVTVDGIEISGFAHDGIFASDSRKLKITSVKVINISSDSWSQGSIHLTGTVMDALIERNYVDGADFAGILFDTDFGSDISNITIKNNKVLRSCRRIRDCGAIYVNDRGRRSKNIIIAGNSIADFGPITVGGRAIYLDDWASNVLVQGNKIKGPGRFAFQIHGGHDNLITDNNINMADIESPLVYHPAANGTRADMTGNVLARNVFFNRTGSFIAFNRTARTGHGAVKLRRNWQCISKKCVLISLDEH